MRTNDTRFGGDSFSGTWESLVAPSATTPAEAPPLTRREAREREAREASLVTAAVSSEASPPVALAEVLTEASAPPAARAEASAPVAASAPFVLPVVRSVSAPVVSAPVPESARARPAAAPRRHPREITASLRRRVLGNLASFGAMVGVGLILVATTVPASAFVRPDAADSTTSVQDVSATQELGVVDATTAGVTRDSYTVLQRRQSTSFAGGRSYSYTNDPNGTVQWPFPSGAPVASGFGARHVANCSYCSTNHQGVDFTPGSGTPIHSIADGVVAEVSTSGSFGNSVVIEHTVNGQKIQSLYGHMIYGSIRVAVGQQVTVGQVVGLVGSTGASTGAHLHLEIHLDGTPVDPFAWLKVNAN